MKNKKSIYLIVAISIFVGAMHFVIGPNYTGIFNQFVSGYLMDILLLMNLYLLLQISLRKKISITKSRLAGAILTFLFGTTVEVLQLYDVKFLGSTYDPLDILMYGIGVLMGILIDLLLIDNFERSISEKA